MGLRSDRFLSPVPSLITEQACCNDVLFVIRSTITSGNQMFGCSLQPCRLAVSSTALPHFLVAVVAPPTLYFHFVTADFDILRHNKRFLLVS
jgi:hypothetical protein